MIRTTKNPIRLAALIGLAVVIGLGGIPGSAQAQDEAACLESWNAVCAGKKDAPAQRACFKEHEDVLPESCTNVYRDRITEASRAWKRMYRTCKKHFVGGVCKNSGGKIAGREACLNEHRDTLDAECIGAFDVWLAFDPDAR